MSQLVSADRAVWQKLLEEGVRPRRNALRHLPLDDALQKALESYDVSFALLPLASKAVPKKDPPKKIDKDPKDTLVIRSDKLKKGKGRGKGKSKGSTPQAILKLGGVSRTPDGENLCFGYNISGCSEAADGARCKKGHHLCAKCFGPHSIQDHEKS